MKIFENILSKVETEDSMEPVCEDISHLYMDRNETGARIVNIEDFSTIIYIHNRGMETRAFFYGPVELEESSITYPKHDIFPCMEMYFSKNVRYIDIFYLADHIIITIFLENEVQFAQIGVEKHTMNDVFQYILYMMVKQNKTKWKKFQDENPEESSEES